MIMERDFDLTSQAWIPVRFATGQVAMVGLIELFRRSEEITALADTTPPSLVAQYRVLLAITHRALTQSLGRWSEKDRALWFKNGLPADVIVAYIEQWRDRFWLFHPEFPFMQVAALANAEETRDKRKPWTQISLASASGNTPVVFDHALDESPVSISPADAIRTLLGFLQFTPGGLVKTIRDADKAGALANTAALIPVGANLSQTLCLGLQAAPGVSAPNDAPAWERSALTVADLKAEPVLASGANDRYTRQSRAVLFLQEADGRIKWLKFAAGQALAEDPQAPDPMAAYRGGTNGLVRLTFSEGRAFWRDLPVLLPNPSGTSQPAMTLSNAMALHQQLNPSDYLVEQPVLVAGLASDQAKLLRWRVEQTPIPSSLMVDAEQAMMLRQLVELAESLFKELKSIGTWMLAETYPDSSSKDTRSRARALLDSGPFATTFFAASERAVSEVQKLIAQDAVEQATKLWGGTLRRSARLAWDQLLVGMGRSPQALRAYAKFQSRFHGVLNKYLPQEKAENQPKEVHV
jgi:CRISPR system Cascade subunit CasA